MLGAEFVRGRVCQGPRCPRIILSLACIGFLISDRCHVRFATLVDNKRDIRDDIEYT